MLGAGDSRPEDTKMRLSRRPDDTQLHLLKLIGSGSRPPEGADATPLVEAGWVKYCLSGLCLTPIGRCLVRRR